MLRTVRGPIPNPVLLHVRTGGATCDLCGVAVTKHTVHKVCCSYTAPLPAEHSHSFADPEGNISQSINFRFI